MANPGGAWIPVGPASGSVLSRGLPCETAFAKRWTGTRASSPPARERGVADTRLKVVTIMNYPPDERHRRMCRAFLDSVIAHGAASLTILYEDEPPVVL